MKVLVVGGGGREHAIVRKLKESPRVSKLYCAPGNGGISRDAECVNISAMDIDKVVSFSKEQKMDLVFVAPDDPLAEGMVDALEKEGIPMAEADIAMIPQNYLTLTDEQALKNLSRTLDLLEDDDDVQNVYTNLAEA